VPADVALVAAFIADAPGSFEAVVAAHQEKVTRLAHRLLGWRSRADVEDVVQDIFFAALRHRRRFRGDASLGTWLSAITVNYCRTHQRRQQLRRLLLLRRRQEVDAEAPASDGPASDDAARRVRSAVQALPPRDREVVVLRYFEQLDAAGIAAVTGLSKNAVEVRLHRARARLAERLGAWHREEQS
jgi:RNA polymerase sigma-70 factor (ECF subfamily)